MTVHSEGKQLPAQGKGRHRVSVCVCVGEGYTTIPGHRTVCFRISEMEISNSKNRCYTKKKCILLQLCH